MEMAALRPADSEAMARINGVGKHKLGRYGTDFLRVIREFCDESGREAPEK